MKRIFINQGLTDNYRPISQSIPTYLGGMVINANTLYTAVKIADNTIYFTNTDDYKVIAYNPYKKVIKCYQDFNQDLLRRGDHDILETLNDYLQDQWVNGKIGKKISSGRYLLDEAIKYCLEKLDMDVTTISYELAMQNKLIGITPDDIPGLCTRGDNTMLK